MDNRIEQENQAGIKDDFTISMAKVWIELSKDQDKFIDAWSKQVDIEASRNPFTKARTTDE